VTIDAPVDGSAFTLGQIVIVNYGCSSDVAIVGCTGTQNPGTTIDTSTLRSGTFTVTATDLLNRTTTYTAHYSVIYKFNGFLSPIRNPPDFNVVKPGSSVPIKFGLNGNRGAQIFATGFPSSQPMSCNSTAPLDPVAETMPSGGSTLNYNSSTAIYTYSWKTDSRWTGCRQLAVRFADGTTHIAFFRFS
jgi:hypothetical protein